MCYPFLVDLSNWARKLSEQEKGEEEGILYNDYGSSDESEGISWFYLINSLFIKQLHLKVGLPILLA